MTLQNQAEFLWESRERRRRIVDLYGSPNFRHTFGAIAATANEFIDMQVVFPASRRYEPLKNLLITNNSLADLDLEINGRDFALVPSGVILPVDDEAIWSLRLINNDAVAAAAGLVRANISTRPLGADEAARRRAYGV